MWVHCPRASNGLLPRRSNLIGYVRWDERSDQSSFPTIISNSFTRSQPSWILSNHTEDQGANLFAETLPSSYLDDSGDPRPIQTKSRSMPVHDGARSDQDERLPLLLQTIIFSSLTGRTTACRHPGVIVSWMGVEMPNTAVSTGNALRGQMC